MTRFASLASVALIVAACGHNPVERTLSGGGIGAAVGAAGAAVVGGSVAGAAALGAGVGALTGALTSPDQINLGRTGRYRGYDDDWDDD